MLYSLHEFQHAAFSPVRAALEIQHSTLTNPFNPLSYTPMGRAVAAACDVIEHATRRFGKPRFGITETEVEGRTVPVAEEIVARWPFMQLKRFARAGSDDDPRLLIVAPLSGHYATLLRDTVRAMVPHFDTYITDWRDARKVPAAEGRFDLDDYIDLTIDLLRRLGPGCRVMAVCQPSVPVLAAAALLAQDRDPARPAAMVLMGGPVDARINPTEPNRFALSHPIEWFERRVIGRVPMMYPGFTRRVYPGFVQLAGFMAMNLDRHIDAHLEMFHRLVRGDGEGAATHRGFYDEYRAVMDLPAEYYLQTIHQVFQKFELARGVMTSRGRRIEPRAMTDVALMTVEGERDDISGLGQTEAAHRLCPNLPAARRLHYVAPKVGHYGVFNGRRWRESTAPKVVAFLRKAARRAR
ncbi:MAG: polyhydroxyalkanoate depolymerase [Alphaproteobacteria bacterium]|nr:polyhydroxyalkanoate depolymerase [Alphaproteobacteria bacterium]